MQRDVGGGGVVFLPQASPDFTEGFEVVKPKREMEERNEMKRQQPLALLGLTRCPDSGVRTGRVTLGTMLHAQQELDCDPRFLISQP